MKNLSPTSPRAHEKKRDLNPRMLKKTCNVIIRRVRLDMACAAPVVVVGSSSCQSHHLVWMKNARRSQAWIRPW